KDAIIQALNMPEDEMKGRMVAMRQMVFKYNIYNWVKVYMRRLAEVKKIQLSLKAGRVKDSIREKIQRDFNNAQKRLILLDYDGTLVGFKKQIELAYPDEELYTLLNQFVSDNKNHTAIISGRKHET